MGYLSDNTPPGKNHVICQELYKFRVIIQPRFASNLTLQSIVKDELPDVEEWQFSGRRRCPAPMQRGKAQSVAGRMIHPSSYAQNSRRMRPFTEEVVFAFHTETQRARVLARLDVEGFKYRIEDEPTPSSGGGIVIIVV
jgi:hypothetical protein